MLRANPGEVKEVALSHDQGSKMRAKHVLTAPTVVKVGKTGNRIRFNAQQVMDGRQIVKTYKKAGYGVSGVTRDGVVIVEPAGKPDSFDLIQLDRALSAVKS
jgi:hypothetical protein